MFSQVFNHSISHFLQPPTSLFKSAEITKRNEYHTKNNNMHMYVEIVIKKKQSKI